MAQVGRISGPLLEANLLRQGIANGTQANLSFKNNAGDQSLLKIDVTNGRIGVDVEAPANEVQVSQTIQTVNLIGDTAGVANYTISNNNINVDSGTIYLNAGEHIQLSNLETEQFYITDNYISTNDTNNNIDLAPNSTGTVEVQSNLNVTGNLYSTGNITLDGNITFGDADTDSVDFNSDVNSNIIPDQTDTYSIGNVYKSWDEIHTKLVNGQEINTSTVSVNGIDLTNRAGNIIYVSKEGLDTNVGDHPNGSLLTIEEAIARVDSSTAGPVTIRIAPGVYEENLPLVIPSDVSVQGVDIRNVVVKPAAGSESKDVFHVDDNTTISDLTIKDYQYDSGNNTGYAFRFSPNAVITNRSPYIQNVTIITSGSVTSASDPRGFDEGDAGKGAWIDGAELDSASIEASMLFHAATFITPGVDAITMTNGVRVEWLNSFTYFANRGLHAFDSNDGLKGDGKTRIRLSGLAGTAPAAAQTVTFTSTDSSTVVGPLTIESVEGTDILIVDGKNTDLIGFDTTPATIAFSGSGTATTIENVDVRDFGAEIRMIGSASVYGNFGLVGDGPGVLVYAIGHNLAYIGNGKEVTNETSTVIQANEVVETNDAQIRYNSVDHKGDFRVGDLFYVNQETGSAAFSVSDFIINTTNGVTFNTGSDTTFVDGTKVETGDWRFSGNTVETLTQDANFAAASGEINLLDNTNITGNLDVTGNVTIGGNITIGDEASDTIQFVAGIDSDITPRLDSTYSLGTATKTWSNLYVNQINVDSLQIRDNYITTTDTDADLELRAAGTGQVLVPSNNVQIDNNLTVDGTVTLANTAITGTLTLVGDLNQTGNYTLTEDLTVGQNLTVGAAAQFEEILIDDNFITTTTSNTDLELRANGTSEILVPNNNVQIDNNLTVDNVFNNNITVSLQTEFNEALVNDITITENYITTNNTNANLELRANGTGKINVPSNNVQVTNNLTVNDTTTLKNSTFSYEYGPELISNGTFNSNLLNWSQSGGGSANATAGNLRIIATGAARNVSQEIIVVAGKTYDFAATFRSVSNANNFYLRIFESGVGTLQEWNETSGLTTDQLLTYSFVPQSTAIDIIFRSVDNIVEWDNVSMFEDIGFVTTFTPVQVNFNSSVDITGTTTQVGDYNLTGNAVAKELTISNDLIGSHITIDDNQIKNIREGLRSSGEFTDSLSIPPIIQAIIGGATAANYPNQVDKNLVNFLINNDLVDVNRSGSTTTTDYIAYLQYFANGTTNNAVWDTFIKNAVDDIVKQEFNNQGYFNSTYFHRICKSFI